MKIKIALCIAFIWLQVNDAVAQINHQSLATAYAGFGAYSVNHADIFSSISNTAALAELKKMTAGVYGEKRFLLQALNNYIAAAAIPIRSWTTGIKTVYAGFNNYNETTLGLAFARNLGAKAALGIQFNYNRISIAGYGNSSAVTIEAGTLLHISEKIRAGFHINNPSGGRFGRVQEKLPTVCTAGIGYDASRKFLFSLEIIKAEDQPVNVNTGLQYRLLAAVLARAGISSATSSLWAGIGLFLSDVRIDITGSSHPQLGFTPGLMIIFPSRQKDATR